jgi:hypothetical protein
MKKNLFDKWGFGRLVAATVFTVALVFLGCGNVVDDGGLAGISPKDGALSVASLASVSLAPGSDTFEDTHLGTLGDGYMYYGTFYEYGIEYHDNYTFDTTNGNYFIYDMTSETPYPSRIVSGEIQYIHHFGDNVPVTITELDGVTKHTFTGPAGVMIIELDHAIDDSDWEYTGSGNFTANYYYGTVPVPDEDEDYTLVSVQNGVVLTSTQNGEDPLYPLESVQMGIVATRTPPIATPCYDDLDDAIDAFDSIASLELYISELAEYPVISF